MITYFKNHSNNKLLKELNIDIVPQLGTFVKVGPRTFKVLLIEFDIDNVTYTVWVK